VAHDPKSITPEDDPYEFDWPDDAKAQRAEEREKENQRALVKPAPLYLSAITIGIGMVLLFILPVAMVSGAGGFFIAVAAPVVIGGLVLALLPAVLLQRVSANWRRGLPEIAFLVLGFAIGTGWTWITITLLQSYLFDNPQQMPSVRAPSSIFMGTAVASAFFGARAWAEPLRRSPKVVYIAASLIGLLTILSLVANFTFK